MSPADHIQLCASASADLATVADDHAPRIMVGFDGFVDNIIDVVDKRIDDDNYERIPTIADFGKRVTAVAGRSTNFERVIKQTKLGGNGPIMANAMLGHGHSLTYVGILGEDPIFEPMKERAETVHNLGPACTTDALEFEDGKLMMTLSDPLRQISWKSLIAHIGEDGWHHLLESSHGIATVNWTQTLGMTDVWNKSAELLDVKPLSTRPLWFVDLADPAKRSVQDLADALASLQKLQQHVDVVLGMNEEENRQVVEALGQTWPEALPALERAEAGARLVQEATGLSWAVVHFVKEAACARSLPDGTIESAAADGFFVEKPLITTGAGDHFNAGFMAGLLAGINPVSCLMVGTASSGYYVRTAISPSRKQLINFLSEQAAG